MTPEGRVKKLVDRLLDQFEDVYRYMPVPTGYGRKTLDYLVCAGGYFVGIETKRPGKEPTGLQQQTIEEIERAGGHAFVVSDEATLAELESFLNDKCVRKPKAPRGRRPAQ